MKSRIPQITITYEHMSKCEHIERIKKITTATQDPLLQTICMAVDCTVGKSGEYLTSILTASEVSKLPDGKSILVCSPTGSGKTRAMRYIAFAEKEKVPVVILTNRKGCWTQIAKDILAQDGINDFPPELIDRISFPKNISVMTYQKFAGICSCYENKPVLLILDECHCFAEDAVFSSYSQKILRFLHRNLDVTRRIYMTATPDAVLSAIWKLECRSDAKLYPFNSNNPDLALLGVPDSTETRINHVYLMQPNWDYITFQTYNPRDKETLIKYLNKQKEQHRKAIVFINNKEAGAALSSEFENSQHIYSDAAKQEDIRVIAINERFESDFLITTTVAENGLSIHDNQLSVIVAETDDMIALRQIIGRARVDRKASSEITVLIPDYSASDLGCSVGRLVTQLRAFQEAEKNPSMLLQNNENNQPYVYYDAFLGKPVLNELGKHELERRIDELNMLRESNEDHAFVRKVLSVYQKSTDNIEELSIDYDRISVLKLRIRSLWETFDRSMHDEEALKDLKSNLRSLCTKSAGYPKEIKGNIQIETVNAILAFAGIPKEICKDSYRVFDSRDSPSSTNTH